MKKAMPPELACVYELQKTGIVLVRKFKFLQKQHKKRMFREMLPKNVADTAKASV